MKTETKPKTKEELEASAKRYQEALEHDVDELLEKAKTILTGAVIIGAGFWVAYRIFKALFTHDEDSDKDTRVYQESNEPSVFSVVKHTIMKELALFLLGILKEKIVEYVQGINAEDDEDS